MKNSDFKDSRLLEAFDFIDQKYIAEVADSLKFEKSAPMPAKGFNRRTWRHIAALAACVLFLGAVIPMMTYLLRNFGDIASWFPEDTTEESNPLTEPETPPEETTTLPPETTEEETTAEETTSEETTAEETTDEETTEETTAEETTSPPEPEYDGSVGLKYSISGNATIGYYMTLDGIGTCTDVDIVVASYYNGYPVKVIDNNAFNGQTHIKSIRLSDTVEIISYGAFRGCSSLESLYISASLKRIDSHVFWDCGNITKIEIDPNNEVFEGKNCIIEKSRKALVLGCRTTVIPSDGSVTRIDGLAFIGVIGLTSITIPEGVTLLSEDAFSGCPDLKSIHFSSTVDSFDLVSVMGCDALEVITVDPKNPRFYSSGNCVIEKATGTLLLGCGKSVIPNDGSIKKIGYYAFGGSNSLVSIVVPEGVTYIDGYAFASCESLKSVYLPDSLITLGYGVFYNSSALETVRIGKNLETIGSSVFDGCSKLNNLSFPKTLKRMGEMVFMECKSLTSVSFEGTGAEWNAIEKLELWNTGAGFTTVKCSDGVLELYEYDGSRGLQYVLYGAYAQLAGIGTCTDKDIVIASTYNGVPVVIIEPGVFKNNKNIRSVSIPNKVHYIGEDAFAFCTELTDLRFAGTVAQWKSISKQEHWNEGAVFKVIHCSDGDVEAVEYDGSRGLVYRIVGDYAVLDGIGSCTDTDIVVGTFYDGYPVRQIDQWALSNTSIKSVKISDTVTRIELGAFSECKSLESIYISASVNEIDHMAFYECPNITSIVIDPDNKFYEGKNCIIEKNSKWLLLGCRTTVIPSDGSVTCIGYLAFYKISGITSVTIPEGVTDIDTSAFYSCPDLREVHLPSTLVWLPGGEGNAFQNCDNIRIITVAANNPKLYSKNNCVIERETGALIFGCASSVIPNDGSVKIIDRYAFGSTASLTEIVIPEGVTEIRQGAFASCTNLKKISLPKSLTEIDSYAFASCTSLESVTLGENVTYIGTDAFRECASLKYVTFPKKVEYLGESVFSGCASLESIILPEGIERIYGGMFIGCSNLKTVVLPDGLKSIGQSAFLSCTALESIVIPDGVTMIDGAAFFNCSGLKSITIPKSVSVINSETFRDCKELTEIVFLGEVSEWKSIKIGEGWNTDSGIRIIKCSDGDIKLYDEPEYDGSRGLEYEISDDGKYAILVGIGTCTDKDIVVATTYNGLPVTKIDSYALYNCQFIESVVIPEGVTIIHDEAFYLCKNLKKVTLPSTLEWIQYWAFAGCESLERITIPDSVTQISIRAFSDCKNLSSLTLGNGVELIEESAFENCTSLVSVRFPKSLRLLANDAFAGCTSLTSVHYAGTIQEWNSVDSTGRDYGNSHVWYEGVPAASVQCSDGDAIIGG